MADFNGFVCDMCSRVWANELKTREKRVFTGFKPIGDFYQELCPECVTPPVGLTPVKTRPSKRKSETTNAEELRGRDPDDADIGPTTPEIPKVDNPE
jgi:hypothetical protein